MKKILVEKKNFVDRKKILLIKKKKLLFQKKVVPEKKLLKKILELLKKFWDPEKSLVVVEIFVGVPGVPKFCSRGGPKNPECTS